MTTVFETDNKRLLALYSMGQELPVFGIDHIAAWKRHLKVLDEYAEYSFDPSRNYQVIGLVPRPSPRIYVHFHTDARFGDGPAAISRAICATDPERYMRVVVAGDSRESRYAGFGLAYADGGSGLNIETLGADEKNFTARLVKVLRNSDDACVTLDANTGAANQHRAPFLRHEIKIREAIFMLARGLRMKIQPLVVDSREMMVYCGPELDVRSLGVKGSIDRSVHFLAQHILRRPEHWLHWGSLMPLSSQTTTIPTTPMDTDEDRPSWIVAPHLENPQLRLALEVATSRLYQPDQEEYETNFAGMATWSPLGVNV